MKKRIVSGIAVLVAIALAVVLRMNPGMPDGEIGCYPPHIAVNGLRYWAQDGKCLSELPEGFVETGTVSKEVRPNQRAEEERSANGFAKGTAIYENSDHPGRIYLKTEEGYLQMVVPELKCRLLCYDGNLYVNAMDYEGWELGESVEIPPFSEMVFADSGCTIHYEGHCIVPRTETGCTDTWANGAEVYVLPNDAIVIYIERQRTAQGELRKDRQEYLLTDALVMNTDYYEQELQ